MRIWFDCEFLEDGHTIDLISIGMVREDDEEYYAVSSDFDFERASADAWVNSHVLNQLPPREEWKPRKQIAEEIVAFAGKNPIFIADFGAYDWVAICQLFGKMIDLPEGWPMFVRDIQQWKEQLGVDEFPILNTNEHNALEDARECAARYQMLEEMARDRGMEPLLPGADTVKRSRPKFKRVE